MQIGLFFKSFSSLSVFFLVCYFFQCLVYSQNCAHITIMFWNIFINPKRNPCTCQQLFLILPPLSHRQTLIQLGFTYSVYFIQIESYNNVAFWVWFFSLHIVFLSFIILQHVTILHSILCFSTVSLYGYSVFSLTIRQLMDI